MSKVVQPISIMPQEPTVQRTRVIHSNPETSSRHEPVASRSHSLTTRSSVSMQILLYLSISSQPLPLRHRRSLALSSRMVLSGDASSLTQDPTRSGQIRSSHESVGRVSQSALLEIQSISSPIQHLHRAEKPGRSTPLSDPPILRSLSSIVPI